MDENNLIEDPQFQFAGKKPGLQIWRIENFKLQPIQPTHHGSFYSGDAYLILKTKLWKSGNFAWDLHFWLGKDSSQDEQGAAAILAIQLDDYLGGEPVQYRETEGNESSMFKSYFKTGIIYKQGGVSSGFNHVRTNDFSSIKRLLHVKGKRNVTAKEVKVSWDSFNRGDSFIIDIGHLIIVFNAAESNRAEQMKANNLAKDIRDRERGGRARVEIVDGKSIIQHGKSEIKEGGEYNEIILELEKVFEAPLPKTFSPPTKDDTPAAASLSTCKLFNISDETGEIVVKEVATSPLKQHFLLHEDCYLIDQGNGQKLFIWKGKLATKNERKSAMKYATQYIEAKNYNSNTCQVEVNNDGGESAIFKQLFTGWKGKYSTNFSDSNIGPGTRTFTNNRGVAKQSNEKFDASTLHQSKQAAITRMPDNGEGEIIIWRVENDKLHKLKDKHHGQFHTGDSYLIFYTYDKCGKEAHIIYIWQGLKSPEFERGSAAFLAVGIDDHYGGEPVQIRVEQGQEPRHFLEIFKGKFVIRNGGYDHVLKCATEQSEISMFHVKGNATYNTKAVEVSANASKLNSNDCFVVITPTSTFIWCGNGANGDEREMAKSIAGRLAGHKSSEVMAEGYESKEFWSVLGGKSAYQTTVSSEDYDELEDYQGRLFECSNASGRFTGCWGIANFFRKKIEKKILENLSKIFLRPPSHSRRNPRFPTNRPRPLRRHAPRRLGMHLHVDRHHRQPRRKTKIHPSRFRLSSHPPSRSKPQNSTSNCQTRL